MRRPSLVLAALALCGLLHSAPAGPIECVTTDPVVVLGQTLVPSKTVCVPPQ